VADPSAALDEAAGAPLLVHDRQHDTDFVAAVRVVDRLMKDKGNPKAVDDLLEIAPERVIGLLQKRALDRLAYLMCGRDVYRANPKISGSNEKISALRLARWCQTLVADARVANHPLNQRLLYERILNSIPSSADN
jgi:hypothetical protein